MTAVATQDAVRVQRAAPRARRDLPAVPLIVCLTALGFLLCVVANAMSRATLSPSPLIFWPGFLLVVAPIVYRMTTREASARERLFLVCLLGMGLYAVKLARDPFMFAYPDELVHAYNALTIYRGEELFALNPILPATPYYPGLEGATAGLMKVGGLGVFEAGVLVIALARLLVLVALFVLFERVSGSARVAGLGAAVYTANPNFLYFNAQFSYESLALPMLVAVLACVALWQDADHPGWRLPIVLGVAAITVTHHLTSYALTGALILVSLIGLVMRRRRPPRNPWRFAAVSAGIVSFWLVFVGEAVVDYLAPVFGRAVEGVQSTVAGRAAPRALFQAKPTESISVSAPLAERAISLVAVLVLAALVFLGMRQLWRSRRFEPMSVLLCLAGLAYFVTLGLRLAPDAWEVGNRASAFLFIGLGFIVASSRLESWRPPFAPRGGRVLLTAGIAVAVMGGVVSGWPSELRLSQPLVVQTDGRRVESEPLAMARWFSDELPGRRIAATVGDARLALVHGRVLALAGARPDVQDILAYPWQAPWMWQLLRENRLRYVVADRRRRATDVERASFFAVRPPKGAPEILRAPGVIDKFEARGAERVLDSGHIVVFDMGERR